MPLNFLGRDSGFGDEHTSAYFIEDNELVIIDCPVSTFQKLKKSTQINLKDFEKIYFLITHTHGDHIGGLGLFIQYAYFTLKVPVVIIAPSVEVGEDIATVLKIEGVSEEWFLLISPNTAIYKNWFKFAIPTIHSPQLEGKCFGYKLNVNGKNVVYTGDTATLTPFYAYMFDAYLYVDTSVHYGQIHLKLDELLFKENLDYILKFNPQTIYLMHLDDVDSAQVLIKNHKIFKIVEVANI